MRVGKQSLQSHLFDVFNLFCLLIFAFICIYPFWFLLVYSLSDPREAAKGITALLPRKATLSNYIQVIQIKTIPRAFMISVIRTVVGGALSILACSFFGYLVSKDEMYFRKFIYRMLIVTMYVGGGLIPTYLVYRMYGLANNFLVYVLPSALTAFNVVLMKTNIEALPPAIEESAVMDGAGILRVWWGFVIPLIKPIIATVGLFAMVGQWNAWFDAHIYMVSRPELHPLQYILYQYLNQAQNLAERLTENVGPNVDVSALTPESVRMTITVVAIIPIAIVYPFVQKYFVQGMLVGAVKG